MKEEENITKYLQRVDEIVNTIRSLGEYLVEKIIVQKVLRSLPMRYDAKVSTLEDREYLKNLTMDELHGILIARKWESGKKSHQKGKQPSKHKKPLRIMSMFQKKISQTYQMKKKPIL